MEENEIRFKKGDIAISVSMCTGYDDIEIIVDISADTEIRRGTQRKQYENDGILRFFPTKIGDKYVKGFAMDTDTRDQFENMLRIYTEKQEKINTERKTNDEKRLLGNPKVAEAIERAKKENKDIQIYMTNMYDGDSSSYAQRKFGGECGMIQVFLYATPEGKTITKEFPCY